MRSIKTIFKFSDALVTITIAALCTVTDPSELIHHFSLSVGRAGTKGEPWDGDEKYVQLI